MSPALWTACGLIEQVQNYGINRTEKEYIFVYP
ncbi:MAG: hypothetical protein JWQ98_1251 [Chlorobi bacterium]|nr:hypothetical protein [Chlorobiota bacterium]